MAETTIGWTLSELAEIVGGEMSGPGDLRIHRPVPAGTDDPHGITFAESAKYLVAVESSIVAAVIVPEGDGECSLPHIKCRSPREAFGRILALSFREMPLNNGVHPTAVVSPDAQISDNAQIGALSVIERGVIIEDGAKIYPLCYIGENCKIGNGSRIMPNVTLLQNIFIGERTTIHSGTVVGADGFGYFWDGMRHRKVPQVGDVIIGDDCEIGALTAIDRATAGETSIGNGTKLDNLIQIAHNVSIGANTVIAGQSGIAGSSSVGSNCTFGGCVMVRDHVAIGDGVNLGGATGVAHDIPEPGNYWGSPAVDAREAIRISALTSKLPELVDRLKRLEREVAELRAEKHGS